MNGVATLERTKKKETGGALNALFGSALPSVSDLEEALHVIQYRNAQREILKEYWDKCYIKDADAFGDKPSPTAE